MPIFYPCFSDLLSIRFHSILGKNEGQSFLGHIETAWFNFLNVKYFKIANLCLLYRFIYFDVSYILTLKKFCYQNFIKWLLV